MRDNDFNYYPMPSWGWCSRQRAVRRRLLNGLVSAAPVPPMTAGPAICRSISHRTRRLAR
ncbi:hypothetical protein I546_3240 [Mycobacterium kansasii 732]|nr:hypothetical protein I546_3240 [Mycobacterium kansasii 732]